MKMRGKLLCIALLLCGCTGTKEEAVSGEEITYACRTMDYYDYTSPVPPSEAIETSYYSDTLFAGDSRMGALYLYGNLEGAEVQYVESLNLWLIDTMPLNNDTEGRTMYDVLSTTEKGNVYLLFGINEIRQNEEYFDSWAFEQYQSILDLLKENYEDRKIYIILTYHPRHISNLEEPSLTEHLSWVNSRLKQLAYDNRVYYLDLDNGMDDEEGLIQDAYVSDGLHLNVEGTKAFEEYIATHVVRGETYVKEVCE